MKWQIDDDNDIIDDMSSVQFCDIICLDQIFKQEGSYLCKQASDNRFWALLTAVVCNAASELCFKLLYW